MPKVDHIATLAKAPTGDSAPDSVALANGDIWVAYTNGANSQGLFGGQSTVVEYDPSGHIDQSYTIPGYVDGLKFNPVTGDIWALQPGRQFDADHHRSRGPQRQFTAVLCESVVQPRL